MVKKKLKRLRAYIVDNWGRGVLILVAIAALGFLLTYKLGSLVGGLAPAEFNNQQIIAHEGMSIHNVVREPIFLPYTALMYLLQATPFTGPTGVRAVGALFGALSAFGMFYIFRKWYTLRIAMLGTLLYVTTSWFLHTARMADPAVSYLLVPLLVAAMIALQAKARSKIAVILAVIFGISTIYIPGIIWFLLPAIIIKRRVIFRALRLQPLWYQICLGLISIVMLAPLAIMAIKPIPGHASAGQNALSLIGIPSEGLHSVATSAAILWDSLRDVFAYSTAGPLYGPGHMPWLDIATVVLVLLGIVQFVVHWRLHRSKLIAIVGLLGLVLIALGGLVSSVVLLPFLFLFVVDGLRWLLERWLSVFPRNPFARGFAVAMVTVLVLSISTYQLNRYFYAWAKAPETHQVFNNYP